MSDSELTPNLHSTNEVGGEEGLWCPPRGVVRGCDVAGRVLPDWFLAPCAPMDNIRYPYVGEGADGAIRSARIDETEAETLDPGDPRRQDLLASAQRWYEQAQALGGPTAD